MQTTKNNRLSHPGYWAFCIDCCKTTPNVHENSWNCAPGQDFGFICPTCMGRRMDHADAVAKKCAEFPKLVRRPWWWMILLLITCGGEG